MADVMMFPNSWGEFLEDYSFKDKEEVYTNGTELVPVFRVEQMVEHYFATDNNDGCKRIEELEAQLAEKEKVVIQLRKQWQDAEMHICTMCGHFNHKADGNVVHGNQTCGEICGYPFCKEKFTPWIPVSERLPNTIPCGAGTAYSEVVNILTSERKVLTAIFDGTDFIADAEFWEAENEIITHWTPVPLPLPEPPTRENT